MHRANYVMTDAIETSAIVYWAEAKNIKRDAEGYVESFQVRDNGDEGERVCKTWKTVNAAAIERAALKILTGEFEIRRDIAAQFVGKEWETDSEGVDCIIQAICFNELTYG